MENLALILLQKQAINTVISLLENINLTFSFQTQIFKAKKHRTTQAKYFRKEDLLPMLLPQGNSFTINFLVSNLPWFSHPRLFGSVLACACSVTLAIQHRKEATVWRLLFSSLFSIVTSAWVPIETESKEWKCKIQMNRSKLTVLCFIRRINMNNRHWVWVLL